LSKICKEPHVVKKDDLSLSLTTVKLAIQKPASIQQVQDTHLIQTHLKKGYFYWYK